MVDGVGRKLTGDVLWTAGSFGVLSLAGLAINGVIAWFRSPAELGIFNLTYAVYIIASQFAVMGVHYSVLRTAAHYSESLAERSSAFWSGVNLSVLLGIAWAALVYFFAGALGQLFDSPASGAAIRYSALGLLLFPLNKVLIAYINGIRHIKMFSVLQAGRYILVTAWIVLVSALEMDFELCGLAFLIAESVTTIASLLYLLVRREVGAGFTSMAWCGRHLVFGGKSLLSGIFLELNTRVDVLIIGVFLTDKEVGVYSFAALLVDGLYHLLAMLRVNANPILVAAHRDGSWSQVSGLMAMSRRIVWPVASLLSLVIVVGFWLVVNRFPALADMHEGLIPLVVLLGSLSLVSVLIPFDSLLLVCGYPAYQTLQGGVIVGVNLILNFLLVPQIGILGAAVGTAASYLAGAICLCLLSRSLVGWNLLANRFSHRV